MGRTTQLHQAACAYLSNLSLWQMIGAWGHLFNPAPREMDAFWQLYILLGAAGPCLYGCTIAIDLEAPAFAAWRRNCFLALFLAFAVLSGAQIDLADYFPLPREHRLSLTPDLVAHLPSWLPWLPHVISSQGVNETIVLHFDGRGFASMPFEHSFDASLADSFDLVAAFPCWKTHSLAFLFLVFGFGINLILLVWTFKAYRHALGHKKTRVFQWFMSHCATAVGVSSMPVAMFFFGVEGGIDWMHFINGFAILLQCKGLVTACDAHATQSAVAELSTSKETSEFSVKRHARAIIARPGKLQQRHVDSAMGS